MKTIYIEVREGDTLLCTVSGCSLFQSMCRLQQLVAIANETGNKNSDQK